jgi:hypothetical protein
MEKNSRWRWRGYGHFQQKLGACVRYHGHPFFAGFKEVLTCSISLINVRELGDEEQRSDDALGNPLIR